MVEMLLLTITLPLRHNFLDLIIVDLTPESYSADCALQEYI